MEDTRNQIEVMMQQLEQERAAASNVIADIIQPILDEAIDLAVEEVQVPESLDPDSPVYEPPGTEDEDEDEEGEMKSAGVGDEVSSGCQE